MTFYAQESYEITMEWGLQGLRELSLSSDTIIIVDVLSFSTCVSIAIDQGAKISPFPWKDERAVEHAKLIGAELAGNRMSSARFTLSPRSMLQLKSGTLLVLPSPNGSSLSAEMSSQNCFAGCLRNARAVAGAASVKGNRIAIIAAGERWQSDNTLRPSLEDLIGAGAIIHFLTGAKSPEARMAESVFLEFKENLHETLLACSSGQELVGRGFTDDVTLAAELNVSENAPCLANGIYVPFNSTLFFKET